MEIPEPDFAIVDIDKLRNYCLSQEHWRGKHKARLFSSILGLTADDAEELQSTLLEVVRTHDAVETGQDRYGKTYVIDFTMKRANRQAKVRSSWIVRKDEDFPRLTSCYILKRRG